MNWVEILQTTALCVGALSLLVIAIASVILTLRLIMLITPFDLAPLEEEEEEMIIEDEPPPPMNRKERRKHGKN